MCRHTKQYNEIYWHQAPVKRAPQWYLDRRMGGSKCGSQDDIYVEAFRTCLREEISKIKKAGLKIDESVIDLEHIRLHSANRNWALCYYPSNHSRTVGGVLLPAEKYCFAFNRRLMKHSMVAYRETVMHELLHVVAHKMDPVKGHGHGSLWQSLASKINLTYGYHISRLSPESKLDSLDKAASQM